MNLKDRAENNLILRRLNLVSRSELNKMSEDITVYCLSVYMQVLFLNYFFNRTDKQIYMSSLICGLIDRRTFICVS